MKNFLNKPDYLVNQTSPNKPFSKRLPPPYEVVGIQVDFNLYHKFLKWTAQLAAEFLNPIILRRRQYHSKGFAGTRSISFEYLLQ